MTDFAGISAAVVGTGFIGTVHTQSLRRLGVQVRGVLGSSAARGAARAAEMGVGYSPDAAGAVELCKQLVG